MEHPFEHLVGERILAHGKYAWRGRLKAVVGFHLILDEAEQLFRADAERVETEGSAKPIKLGDGVVIHSDWLEAVIPEANCAWAVKPGKKAKA